jgi:tetratricopeptide (TPR) repeat protein
MAEEEYLHALQYLKNEEQKKESFFYEVYRYYMKKNRYSDALKVMQQAIEILPDNSGIRVTAGDLYEKLGLTFKAIESYRHVLVIDPKNQSAQKKLDDLLLKNKGS